MNMLVEILQRNGLENVEEVERLKKELESTDYKIVKASEYSLMGLESPYDMAKLHAERQMLRDRINELEN